VSDLLAGPFLAFAGLLIVGGLLKVRHPHDTGRALRVSGLPVSNGVIRAAGLVEAAVATAAVLSGNRALVAMVGASYLGFAAFVTWALARQLPLSSCGCLGQADTPPSVGHVALDLLAAAVSLAVVARPLGSLSHVLGGQSFGGAPLVILAAVTAFLLTLVMGPLAVLRAAPRPEVGR
jgi:hypothetical protein